MLQTRRQVGWGEARWWGGTREVKGLNIMGGLMWLSLSLMRISETRFSSVVLRLKTAKQSAVKAEQHRPALMLETLQKVKHWKQQISLHKLQKLEQMKQLWQNEWNEDTSWEKTFTPKTSSTKTLCFSSPCMLGHCGSKPFSAPDSGDQHWHFERHWFASEKFLKHRQSFLSLKKTQQVFGKSGNRGSQKSF